MGENVLLFGFDKDGIDNGKIWLSLFLERYAEGDAGSPYCQWIWYASLGTSFSEGEG